jgi:hypothetical protein
MTNTPDSTNPAIEPCSVRVIDNERRRAAQQERERKPAKSPRKAEQADDAA